MVRNLPRAFLTATLTTLCLFLLGISGEAQLFQMSTSDDSSSINIVEVFIFIALGVVCGCSGAAFCCIVDIIVGLRNSLLSPNLPPEVVSMRRYSLVIIITLLTSAMLYVENAIGFVSSTNPAQILDISSFGTFMFDKLDYGVR
jgi:H+/Cl- antiporter ClcA